MMEEIKESVFRVYNESSLVDLLPERFYYQQAPQFEDGTYGIFSIENITRDEYCGGAEDVIRTADLQFQFFSNADDGGLRLANIIDECGDTYDWQIFTISGYATVKMQPISITNILYVDSFWQATVSYELAFIKE